MFMRASERMRPAWQTCRERERESERASLRETRVALKREERGRRTPELDCTFTDENFMTLNLDRLLVSVRITAAARTFMNY